jgi:hypothetical protein
MVAGFALLEWKTKQIESPNKNKVWLTFARLTISQRKSVFKYFLGSPIHGGPALF